MKLNDLKFNDANPRYITESGFNKLVASIKEFPKMMAIDKIKVDENNIILAGNQRARALKELGYEDLPPEWVEVITGLTEDEKRQFIIKDNTHFGAWDFDLLANTFEPVDLEAWGVKVQLTPEDLEKKALDDEEFMAEFEKIKNEDVPSPIVPDFMEDYNAFIIITKNEIDENFIRETFDLNKSIGNNNGVKNRKANVLTVEQVRKIWTSK